MGASIEAPTFLNKNPLRTCYTWLEMRYNRVTNCYVCDKTVCLE